MQLSKHFSLEEFTRSERAEALEILNEPAPEDLENLIVFCQDIMEPLRELTGVPISISSGYRCPDLNDEVGGSHSSYHVSGLAADIHAVGLTPLELARLLDHADIPYDKMILEFGRWVHIQGPRPGNIPRRQSLTARRTDGETEYVLGVHG